MPGSRRLIPSSVVRDQLLCLPEPLTPANGFHEGDSAFIHAGCNLFKVCMTTGCDLLQCSPVHKSVQAHAVQVQPHYAVSLQLLQASTVLHLHLSCMRNSLTDSSEVMVIHLLSFRRHSSKKSSACINQVFSLKPFSLSTRKYSCSAPTDGVTFLDVVFPKSRSSRSAVC